MVKEDAQRIALHTHCCKNVGQNGARGGKGGHIEIRCKNQTYYTKPQLKRTKQSPKRLKRAQRTIQRPNTFQQKVATSVNNR